MSTVAGGGGAGQLTSERVNLGSFLWLFMYANQLTGFYLSMPWLFMYCQSIDWILFKLMKDVNDLGIYLELR